MSAELLDLAEYSVELQRVLADNAGFQKESVRRAGTVPDFTQAIHSLVRIESNDGTGAGPGLHHSGHSHVCDLQSRRRRIRVHCPGISGQRFLEEQSAPEGKGRAFDHIATAKLMFAHCDPTFEECKLNRDRLLRSRQLRRLWHHLHLSDSATVLPFSQLQDEDCKLPAEVLRLTNRLLFESFRDIFPVGGSS